MRVIAGTARSLPLKAVEGLDTRPTTDRIKETLFNMIQQEIPGAYFLDLYAGSGQIGIEALSRGASYAVFVDNGKKQAGCIQDNLTFTKFQSSAKLINSDVLSALRMLEGRYQFDVIFMDPPYNEEHEKNILAFLQTSSIMKLETLVIVEASLTTELGYADTYGFKVLKEKVYKTNKHVFLQKNN